MNEFFGIDMTYIMIALLCVLFVAVGSIAYVLIRNRVMFQVGVRNIPRRRAQTVLIIIGLMLSTLIISTALSIGDTADYSITSQTYNTLQSIDELVSARADEDNGNSSKAGGDGDSASEDDDPTISLGLVSAFPIPEEQALSFVEEFKQIEGVDGVLPAVRAPAPVLNRTKGQAEAITILMGLPDDTSGFGPDLRTTDGEEVSIAGLAENEVYASEAAADELDIEVGDTIVFTVNGTPHEFTATAILNDTVLSGSLIDALFGFALPLERLQDMTNRPDEIDFIVVSNDGGVRDSLDHSEPVTDSINEILDGTPWAAEPLKENLVESADQIASIFTTFFVVLGLFSIAAGLLLIFLIFVMLAAERKGEMGMVRAVGTKRSHLVQMFMSEGMVYNMVAAAIGCALGIAVSIVLVGLMARLFADFGLQITFHVTAQSLIVAYSIGVVLTFLTVVFSSYRIANLNIVSAIRDTADPVTRKERPHGVFRYILWVLFKPESWGQLFRSLGLALLGGLAVAAGVGLFIGAAAIYGEGAFGSVMGVLLGVFGGFIIAFGAALVLIGLSSIFQYGPLLLGLGIPILISGLQSDQAFPFGAGLSMAIIGAALLVRFVGAPPRPVFTAMGLVMLVFWLVLAGGNSPWEKVNNLEGDIEMFFLSGVTMVIAGTFVLVYNADLLLGGLTLLGSVFSSLVPPIKTAVAYPLANKFRTGMTIAMISLVMFALVMFSTMNENFDRIFLSDDALAGYDVIVSENPGNPIDDLAGALSDAPPPTTGGEVGDGATGEELAGRIAGDDTLAVASRQVSKVRQLNIEDGDSNGYSIYGMSEGFLENNELTFSARAAGMETDAAVLEALRENPDYVVIDQFGVSGDGFDGGTVIEGIDADTRSFEPIPLTVSDSATGETREVKLIGVFSVAASGLFGGLFMSGEAFGEVFKAESTLHYLRLVDGADANATAKGIERTLLSQGVQADSLRQVVDDYQAQSRGFLYLMQAFMGIGLFVGIAAVGVIAFRTVVERRQQIGMLRAIGFSRGAIALSFLMESSFTALLGIVSGIALGLLLAQQLVKTDDFVAGGVDSFYIPWLQIFLIGGFAFVCSLIMTIIPSRQASSIPIAEALRYE